MSITGIIMAAVIVGGTGLFIGIFLGLADKKLTVKVDEKEEAIPVSYTHLPVKVQRRQLCKRGRESVDLISCIQIRLVKAVTVILDRT